MLKILCLTLVLVTLTPIHLSTQEDTDATMIKDIHSITLSQGSCYNWLTHLSENIGGRLAGSTGSEKAIDYTYKLISAVSDTTYKQACTVPYWERGAQEEVLLITSNQKINIGGLALGNSISTPIKGIEAEIIEVTSLDEVKELGTEHIKDKIVFFNRPMAPTQINTFFAYGGAADQRVNGPSLASEYGAIGAMVRSLTTLIDDSPHTGVTRYKDGINPVPAVAISTEDANALSTMLKTEQVKALIKTNCNIIDTAKTSYNVIGEIKGSEYPEEIILIGGHLDAWDIGGGAHDDGAGCVHSIQVLETLKELNYAPKRTIRCVMFMNEENGLGGGLAYAKKSNLKNEKHIAAIESDAGGFSPNGFSCEAIATNFSNYFRQISNWESLLSPYFLQINKGGSGADISPLKSQGGLLIGLRPDSQRYFDYHHSSKDRIEAVNERELKLGAAAVTSLVYLLDKYGLETE